MAGSLKLYNRFLNTRGTGHEYPLNRLQDKSQPVPAIDFTSSLYLAMKHSSAELHRWNELTTGVPSALFEPPQSKELACQVSGMQGLEAGFTAPSTLHLYSDLYDFLCKQPLVVFIDEKAYPVSHYGIEKLYQKKIPIHRFSHLNAEHLHKLVVTSTRRQQTPVVITDGWCPQCGHPAPLNVYSKILQPYNGNLILDDTQAMGIFGAITGEEVYGKGGGGTLKWLNVKDPDVISITSLAKAFGAPLAVISGSRAFIKSFKNNSQTAAHSSPASLAHISAGLHALQINNETGDYRRKKLFNNVSLLRNLLKETRIKLNGGIFPVQSVSFRDAGKANAVFDNLDKQGIKTVLTAGHDNNTRSVTFVIRCDHSINDIKTLAYCLKEAVDHPSTALY